MEKWINFAFCQKKFCHIFVFANVVIAVDVVVPYYGCPSTW